MSKQKKGCCHLSKWNIAKFYKARQEQSAKKRTFQAEMWQENRKIVLKSIFPCGKYQHKQKSN